MAAHSYLGKLSGLPVDVLRAVRAGRPSGDAKRDALVHFVLLLLATSGSITQREFTPVLTSGTPTTQEGVSPAGVGVIRRFDGSLQVTYDGHPLYIYSQEQPLVGEEGLVTTGSAGNGDGISAFGGTFDVVSP